MAEIVVSFVVNKLCDAVLQEIFFLCGVKDKVERVKRDLIRIQCFLKDADRKRAGDERVRNWVNELRDLSHWIEDTVDLFVLRVDESSGEYPGSQKPSIKEKMKRWLKRPAKVALIHKFGKEMDKILARIDEIAASREKYGIENLVERAVPGIAVAVPIIPDLDDTELVGVAAEKEKIVDELLDQTCLRRSVVSIVGPGGLGKSTVAAKAYSSDVVKSNFNVRIWVSISQNFMLINLLKKILEGIRPLKDEDKDRDIEYFMKVVNKSLRGKKYLIVMDDVWSEDLWPQIAPVLPDDKNGSRVLITSRFSNVPTAADSGSHPNELRFLSEEESLELLLRTALHNRTATEGFIASISDLAKQLAHKCDGLPLALVVLGGLLSRKPLTYHAWQNVSRTMVWSEQGKRCIDILTTSYDDMPVGLKSCFMYLAGYPDDYKIDADYLIQLWIAEGLVPHMSSRTLEDTAEDYLEELVQRSMVQALKRSPWGSIKTCGLHDLMRDVAIQKAKEDNFLIVCSNRDVEQSCGRARRVAVHYRHCEVMEHSSSKVRSFLCFNDQIQNISGHKLLRVLHYFDLDGHIEVERIDGLTQLRYLRIAGYLVQNNKQVFNKLIGGLKYLQTLDFSCLIGDYDILDCIWHIKTLRHVLLHETSSGPPPWVDLKYLQTLSGVSVPESWETTALPNLPNVRVLKIKKRSGSSWEVLVAFLHTLKNLEHLFITGNDIPIEVVDMRAFPFYHLLKYLEFNGKFSCFDTTERTRLDASMFPSNLTSLSLSLTEIDQDVMPVLEKLQGLKYLLVGFYACESQKLRCTAGGFPQLDNLKIALDKGVEWEIEEGAMPVLKSLTACRSSTSQVIRGLNHLTALRSLTYID